MGGYDDSIGVYTSGGAYLRSQPYFTRYHYKYNKNNYSLTETIKNNRTLMINNNFLRFNMNGNMDTYSDENKTNILFAIGHNQLLGSSG